MQKSPGSKLLVCLLLSHPGLAAAAATSQPSSATPFDWQNASIRVRYLPQAERLELSSVTANEFLRICIFPTRIDTDSGRLPVAQAPVAAERVPSAGGESWRFSATATDAERGITYLYTSEFDLDVHRAWIRRHGRIRMKGRDIRAPLLTRVVLDETDVTGLGAEQPNEGWQSYPVLSHSFFWGVEFPVARAVVKDNKAELSFQPGLRFQPDAPYELWPVVYGASPGQTREAFEDYIQTLRPHSAPVHIQYNSWWSLPFPYTQPMMLDLIDVFAQHLHRENQGRLDSFCLDLGWSDRQSIWQIDRKSFPEGFAPLAQALRRMDSGLGLWVSPSSIYPQAQDLEWARTNGFETLPTDPGHRAACLAGPHYQQAFKKSLVQLERAYHIAHFKFDGYLPTCSEKDHEHEPGELSAQPMALGLIDTFVALRKANADVWLEATCFGYRPSPWWLAYLNTVIGTFGDDAPAGRTPCPIYRESYTTARDFFNLQGARDVLIPIHTQEVLGVIHQTREPFENDAVVAALRGHAFLPLYVNPKYMDDRRWRFLARWAQWVRSNADLLARTRTINTGLWNDPKASREWTSAVGRDPYGYAHFDASHGLILLRNPWIEPRTIALTLDETIGCPASFPAVGARSIYPRVERVDGTFRGGGKLTLALAPYETRLIELGQNVSAPPPATMPPPAVHNIKRDLAKAAVSASFEVDNAHEGETQLLILTEGERPLAVPQVAIQINGTQAEVTRSDSAEGWRASGLADPRAWSWTIASLPRGQASINLRVSVWQPAEVSAWVVARQDLAESLNADGPLPPPEFRYTAALAVLQPTKLDFKRPAGESNLALATRGAHASASSVYGPEYTANFAMDGAAQTRWNSRGGDVNGAWLQVDLPAASEIREFRFDEAAGGRITSYKLQTWNGRNWSDVLSATKPAHQLQVRHRFDTVRTRRIRLLVVAATELPSIFEMQVFGTAPNATSQSTGSP